MSHFDLDAILLEHQKWLDAGKPINDKRRADLSGKDLSDQEFKDLNLEGALLTNVNFNRSILENAIFNGASLSGPKFIKADLRLAQFEDAILVDVYFTDAQMDNVCLDNANLSSSDFSNADLDSAKLKGANFDSTKIIDTNFSNAEFQQTDFKNVKVTHSRELIFESTVNCVSRFKGVNAQEILHNPMLSQYAADQAYLAQYAKIHKSKYFLWLGLSDCGRSFFLLGFWSIVIATIFTIIYINMGPCEFELSNFQCKTVAESGIQEFLIMLYYSVVTFTTLGFGDITPKGEFSMIIVMFEVILGYIFLGMLISVLSNKVARRS